MWGFEHTAMMTVAAAFSWWLFHSRNYSWAMAVFLSQIPFWGGLAAYMLTGTSDPASVNAILNIFAAGIFIELATRLQQSGKGGIVHVWLCLVFTLACTLDVMHLIVPLPFYFIAQEALHYVALLVIGGRAYVQRYDGYRRYRRNIRGSDEGGSLV